MPPYRAPGWVATSGLAQPTQGWPAEVGLVDAGLVDAAAVRTRPSGGALRPPVTVSRQRLLLVETDRAGQPQPSVPVVDLLKPRRSTWLVDRYVLPVLYFRRILRGRV